MNIFKTLLGLFCILGIFMLTAPDADAARMGGGRSFGASPSIKAPITKAPPVMTNPGVAGAAGAAQVGGVARSGFGGLFGGLLAGSLIGSLFMGGGLGGGLGGFGIFDMLLIGLVIFLVFKLLGSRMQKREAPQKSQAKPYDMWSNLTTQAQVETVKSAPVIENFNQEEFLKGAKIAFTRLQSSWDKRELDDIAQFANEEVMETIREQAKDEPDPSKTEILMINASIVNAAKEKNQEMVSVYFDVLMREDKEETSEVKEIWHFERPNAESMWKLAGIKQVN